MSELNKEVFTVEPDSLIYDGKHPIDCDAVKITLSGGALGGGTIKRGQVIDENAGAYDIHAENGTPSVVAAEDTAYDEEAETVVVPVYTSGTLRKSKLVAEPELTEADAETLREKGIFLK